MSVTVYPSEPEIIRQMRSRLRDLKRLYAQGLIERGELEKVSDEIEYAIRDSGIIEEPPVPAPKPKKRKDDFEEELVKNIVADVLTNRLKCSRSENDDSYRFELYGKIPRELLFQGSIRPMIEHLEDLKRGLAKMIDDAIVEIKERNGSRGW